MNLRLPVKCEKYTWIIFKSFKEQTEQIIAYAQLNAPNSPIITNYWLGIIIYLSSIINIPGLLSRQSQDFSSDSFNNTREV